MPVEGPLPLPGCLLFVVIPEDSSQRLERDKPIGLQGVLDVDRLDVYLDSRAG
jgi:hypothetical protein